MADKIPDKEGIDEPKYRMPMFKLARNVLLAGVGAMALAQDEIEDFVNKLIERGEIAEIDGRALVQEIIEKRKKRLERAEDEFGKRFEVILERWNIPTKADFDSLSNKISSLTKKVEEIKKSQA